MRRPIDTITADTTLANWEKARECLMGVAGGDTMYLLAAQAFATLAVADALTDGGGTAIADIARNAAIAHFG